MSNIYTAGHGGIFNSEDNNQIIINNSKIFHTKSNKSGGLLDGNSFNKLFISQSDFTNITSAENMGAL